METSFPGPEHPADVFEETMSNNHRRNSNSSNNQDGFTDAIERILAAQDSREEEENLGTSSSSVSKGPLTHSEISKLSMLCTLQSSRKKSISSDLGFADVEPDLVAELVTLLEKHVNLASNVKVIRAAHQAIQQTQVRGNRVSVDQVRSKLDYNMKAALIFCAAVPTQLCAI